MHFNEMYNLHDAAGHPLAEVLARNPASRRVRWRPGTRMSYSNPGYGVAGVRPGAGDRPPVRSVIRERIFDPLGMRHQQLHADRGDDLPLLAQGYDSPTGPPVPFTQIYLRPAGNLHTSPRELGAFVQMLLNWGETADAARDRSRVSRATWSGRGRRWRRRPGSSTATASGIASSSLGGLSRARPRRRHRRVRLDIRLLRGARRGLGGARQRAPTRRTAVERLSELAVRYLKRDVEPPAKPEHAATPRCWRRHAGYYHPEGSRNELLGALTWMTGGATLAPDGNALVTRPVFGSPERYVPVSDTLFRRERDVTPSRVFTTDEDGRAVLLGDGYYGVQTPRWRVEDRPRRRVAVARDRWPRCRSRCVVWLVRLFWLRTARTPRQRTPPGSGCSS